MNRFSYARATDLPGAVREAAAPRAKFIAGGTNLIDLMKYNVEAPSRLRYPHSGRHTAAPGQWRR